MKQFIVTVKHDKGIKKIRTAATDKVQAAQIVMLSECCPDNAIISVREAMYYRKSFNNAK